MSVTPGTKHLTDLRLITCVVERGMADGVVKAALKAGAPAATICFARGSGIRERLTLLLKIAISPEKEVIDVVASAEQADAIFDAMAEAAEIDLPGKGILWMIPILKAVTHVSDSVAGTARGGSGA